MPPVAGRAKPERVRVIKDYKADPLADDKPNGTSKHDGAGDASDAYLWKQFGGKGGTPEGRRATKYITVTRLDPPEGYLGRVDSDATEDHIVSRWGGGLFKFEARKHGGDYVDRVEVRIAAEPKFQSRQARAEYQRAIRLAELDAKGGAELGDESGGLLGELKKLITDREEQHRRDLERIREEAKADVQRREGEAASRIREIEAQSALQERRDRAFYEALSRVGPNSGGAERTEKDDVRDLMFIRAMKQIIRDDDGEEKDPLITAFNKMPETLREVRRMYDSRRRSRGGKSSAPDPDSRRAAAMRRARELIDEAEKAGFDPAQAVEAASNILTRLAREKAAGAAAPKRKKK